ncbi:DUF4142 domain-containing protein [Marinimicrobium sp. C2-29]|uniref:DUF4142 domain-containing protein n=1 Tax=Marinimicrobium sp. C2-29 TaxID=3139825 RepID=UPI00313900A3
MNRLKRTTGALMLMFVTVAVISATTLADSAKDSALSNKQMTSDNDAVKKLSMWSPGPRLAGYEMIEKYGAPQEVTDERMIWHNAGPFKRILLTREQRPHHFPIVHMDYLQHTISYDVPANKADEVLAFDGAISIYRVGGELSARCDLESNNVLTLNLAHEIIEGDKSVEQARKEFGEAVMARTTAKSPAITAELQFKPQAPKVAADTDTVSIPGAPRPEAAEGESVGPDAETLALLIASDMDEVHAAMIAKNKEVADPILDYARTMHESHGKHIKATVALGLNSNVTPVVTKNVSELREKHAAALAEIVMLDGDAFGHAYIDLMVKAHSNALNLIEKRITMTKNEEVKSHLTETRKTITMHLQQAKDLQSNAT